MLDLSYALLWHKLSWIMHVRNESAVHASCVCCRDSGVLGAGEAGRLTSSSSGPLPGSLPGGLPGQSLEAFRGMDSSAQLAFLQHLAAVKRGTADSKWLQACAHSLYSACVTVCRR